MGAETPVVVQKRNVTEWLSLAARSIVSGAAFVSNLCLVAMLTIIFLNVIFRYVILRPLYWGDELMTYLMIIMVYAGFGFMLAEGGHIRMTLLFNKLSRKTQNVFWIIVSVLGTAYTTFLLYAVILLVVDTLQLGSFSMITRWPIAPWQILVALGLFSLLLAFIMLVIQRIGIALGIREEKETEEKVVRSAE